MSNFKSTKIGDIVIILIDRTLPTASGTIGRVTDIDEYTIYIRVLQWGDKINSVRGKNFHINNNDVFRKATRDEVIMAML